MMDLKNRMYPVGPNRKDIRNMLNNDRKIVSEIIYQATAKVLEEHYGFDAAKLNDFRVKVQAEINRM